MEIVIPCGETFPACVNHPHAITEWNPVSDPLDEIPHASQLSKKKKHDPAA
jgi:hypothetical protein